MACADDVMNQEAAYLEALSQVQTYTITGDRLTLSDAGSTSVLVFTAQSQDLAVPPGLCSAITTANRLLQRPGYTTIWWNLAKMALQAMVTVTYGGTYRVRESRLAHWRQL
jgi:hypothetical protein